MFNLMNFITDHPALLTIHTFVKFHPVKTGLIFLSILFVIACKWIGNASSKAWDDMPVWDEVNIALEEKSLIKKCSDDVYRYAECRAKGCVCFGICTAVEHTRVKSEESLKVQRIA